MIPLFLPFAKLPPLRGGWRLTTGCVAILLLAGTPGRVARAQGSSDPVTTAPDKPSTDEQGIEFRTKVVELSPEAVRVLQDKVRQGNESARGFADQLAAVLNGPGPERGAPGKFALTRTLPAKELDTLLRDLNETKGADLLSAPRVTTRLGQKATVELSNELTYPAGAGRAPAADDPSAPPAAKSAKEKVGFTLEMAGDFTAARDALDLGISRQQVDLEGFVRASDGQPVPAGNAGNDALRPVLSKQTIVTHVTVPLDATAVLGTLNQSPAPAPGGNGVRAEKRLVLTFVTPMLVEAPASDTTPSSDTAATAPSAPPDAPSVKAAKLPFGIPVPGKPGFVTSPYAPDAGYVDLQGFARGDEVRDPYTGKLFLVP